MPICVAINCCNKSYRKAKNQINLEKNVDITFHQFPKDETKKLTWIKVMGLRVESLPKSPHLCSLHFSESDFDRSSLMRTRLRENAIPIPSIAEVKEENTEILFMPNTSVNISLTESIYNNDLTSSTSQDKTSVSNDELTLESETVKIQTRNKQDDSDDDNEIMSKRKRHCSTLDQVYINQRLEDTLRKKLLRQALLNQKKHYETQMRTLRQKNKRQEKRIAKLSTILKELKQKSLYDR